MPASERKGNLLGHFRVEDERHQRYRQAWRRRSESKAYRDYVYTFSDWIRDACDAFAERNER